MNVTFLKQIYLNKLVDPTVFEQILKMRQNQSKSSFLDPPVTNFPVLSYGDLP